MPYQSDVQRCDVHIVRLRVDIRRISKQLGKKQRELQAWLERRSEDRHPSGHKRSATKID